MPAAMEQQDFIEVGRTFKTHGIRGGLKIRFNFPLLSLKDRRPTSLFVGKSGRPLPYFIKSMEEHGEDLYIITFEEFDTPEKAVKLANSNLYMPEATAADFFEIEEEEGEFTFLEGYRVFDQDNKEVGKIEEVLLYPHQELARVFHYGREALIPLIDDIIISIDDDQQTVHIEIAEGLLEL
jgi:16S rRNA processing protein RimM